MTTFKYIGEAPNGPFQMYGATWDHGLTADVSDPVYAAKLKGNPFFEEVGAQSPDPTETAKKPAKKRKPEVADDRPDAVTTE